MANGFTSTTCSFELRLYEAEDRGEDKDELDRGSLYTNGVLVGSQVYCVGSLQRSYNTPPLINVCKLDVTTNVCHTLTDPEGVVCGQGISLCLTRDYLLTFGGSELVNGATVARGLRKFDLVVEEWTDLETPDMPQPRAMCSGVLVDERRFVVFGGYIEPQQYMSETWVYDLERRTWKEVAAQGQRPRGRWMHDACVSEDYGTGEQTMYMFGGYNGRLLGDLHMLHCSRKRFRWSQPVVRGHYPPQMNGHRMMYFDGKILLCGGSAYRTSRFLSVYEVNTGMWYEVQPYHGIMTHMLAYALFDDDERDTLKYVLYGHNRLDVARISAHAAVPCSKGLMLLFGTSSTRALLVPR